jgi:hypothetical protein
MKGDKNASSLAQFFKFLTTDDLRFRKAVLWSPFVTAVCAFILNWLVLDKSFSESSFASAFVFLIICFIGLVYEVTRRRNLR